IQIPQLSSNPSDDPKPVRTAAASAIIIPKRTLSFTMDYEQFKIFFDRKEHKLSPDWTSIINEKLIHAKLKCTFIFEYKHIRINKSQKTNSPSFTCVAHCKHKSCHVVVQVKLQNEPPKNSTSLFAIEILGKENHEGGIASRPLSGTQRAEIAKGAETLGPLNAYERNIHKADENLLKKKKF
ncbi:unnamed protein product, partial [Didymodactylos carnosus]